MTDVAAAKHAVYVETLKTLTWLAQIHTADLWDRITEKRWAGNHGLRSRGGHGSVFVDPIFHDGAINALRFHWCSDHEFMMQGNWVKGTGRTFQYVSTYLSTSLVEYYVTGRGHDVETASLDLVLYEVLKDDVPVPSATDFLNSVFK